MPQINEETTTSLVISKQTARRFVLGRQGLWPGRRWKGKKGTAEALRACEAIQLDPLDVVGRSQDIVLHSRVLDYSPHFLQQLMYSDREFFDYGVHLAVYPMSEMPYWQLHMQNRSHEQQVEDFVFTNDTLFETIRNELRRRGPLRNRDLEGKTIGSWNYRGRKETSLALYLMWLNGELMIHHRDRFERVYDFRELVSSGKSDSEPSDFETEEFFARKAIALKGLLEERRWKTDLGYFLHRRIDGAEMRERIELWKEEGKVASVKVATGNDKYVVLGEDVTVLNMLEIGKVPKEWKPINSTTVDEVTFLAPLDIVSARGRTRKLFEFEYLWEVYKPPRQRRWGYYTLPILYGDDLVARLDPTFDRATMTLQIMDYWSEKDAPSNDKAYQAALGRGLVRFGHYLNAKRINIASIRPLKLRQGVRAEIAQFFDVSVREIDRVS